MYPMVLMILTPLSGVWDATLPHVFVSSLYPPVPSPNLVSQLLQSFCSLFVIPILALECWILLPTALNPSLLQFDCREACDPISVFHVSRPSEVARYCPSAMRECREWACLLTTKKLVTLPTFIPRQILEKDVFQ